MSAEPFIPTPEMIAAAWDAWAPRRNQNVRIGPGPAFREAIQAAFDKMPEAARPAPASNRSETEELAP
jgi:hypothetical protein